jgi:tRNA 5-methylaminomethyl-2-thiouridine biosynthesis bifunctional protein
MPNPLAPARLAFAADGTPYSHEYGDVYHSTEGGLAQARHVFLQGNGLPERWRGRRTFTVLETGFGFGLSFLATWRAWREDPARCERLHFVSIEKHPFAASDLALLWEKYSELKKENRELQARWPMLVPGMHRLEFDGGSVVLTLFLGDVAEGLPQLRLAADAIFLDGFAPAKNPDMWEPRVLRHLGRLAAPGATLATWSVAAPVRAALESAGFSVEKRPGFGSKKEMLGGSLIPRFPRASTSNSNSISSKTRSAIVIGAGVAGAAVSERLASRGWKVTLVERHAGPAAEASGNPAAIFHPVVSPDDSLFARFTRASFLFLLNHWKNLGNLEWERCGVLQLARDDAEKASQRRALEPLAYPARYAQFDDAKGGIWFPEAGWVKPRSLVEGLLSRFDIEKHFDREVSSLSCENNIWKAKDSQDKVIASAAVVVLANAADALRLAPQPEVRLRCVRGQLTLLPAIEGLEHVVLRGGMALPGVDGVSVIGASYDIGDEDPEPRADSHAGNLARLEQMLPGASRGLDPSKLGGRVAFRAVVPDRLPMIGPISDTRGAGLYGAFAYGSRGLLWAGLAGELLASIIEGEPLPVERKLAAAVDPGRFALRAKRRGLTSAPA